MDSHSAAIVIAKGFSGLTLCLYAVSVALMTEVSPVLIVLAIIGMFMYVGAWP